MWRPGERGDDLPHETGRYRPLLGPGGDDMAFMRSGFVRRGPFDMVGDAAQCAVETEGWRLSVPRLFRLSR